MRIGTKWRWGAVSIMLIVAASVALATAGVAAGDGTLPQGTYANKDCEHCHDVSSVHDASNTKRADFTAGQYVLNTDIKSGVNYTLCKNCHLPEYSAGRHPHNAPGLCSGCHPGYSTAIPSSIAWVNDPAAANAAFNSLSSRTTTASALHAIHSQMRWPAGMSRGDSKCASCHSIAACDACHVGDISGNIAAGGLHASHATTAGLVPWTARKWTRGYPTAGAQPTNTSVSMETSLNVGTTFGPIDEQYCGSVSCHNFQSFVTTDPASVQENESHPAAVAKDGTVFAANNAPAPVYAGTWLRPTGSAYSMQNRRVSNNIGATATFTFRGSRVVLVSDKDPFRGIARISIDGQVQKTVDLYRATSVQQVPVYDSTETTPTMLNGTHTISIEVTDQKNSNSGDYFVLVDQIKVYKTGLPPIAPKCTSCHAHDAASYGTSIDHPNASDFSHIATAQAGTESGFACSQCHSMKLFRKGNLPADEYSDHELSSATGSRYCDVCHPRISAQTPYGNLEGYAYTCSQVGTITKNGCHVASAPGGSLYGTVRHVSMNTSHTVSVATDPASSLCFDCHDEGRLDLIHYRNNTCKTAGCHAFQSVPTKKSCMEVGCHAGKTMNNHNIYVTAKHQATAVSGVTTSTGGTLYPTKLCTACHDATLDLSKEHTQTLSPKGPMDCDDCHGDTATGARNVAKTFWPAPKNCASCHKTGAYTIHNDFGGAHNFTGREGTCGGVGCHGPGSITPFNFSNIATMHADMTTTVGGVALRTSCNICHIDADTGIARVGVGRTWTAVYDGLNNLTSCNSCHEYADIAAHANQFDHLATAAGSNYNNAATYAASPAGCTNSGSGCHPATYDLKVVHNKTMPGCSSTFIGLYNCHDINGTAPGNTAYSSVVTGNNECVECHNGAYVGPPATSDRNPMTDTYPAGHYNVTTHTADATYMQTQIDGGTYTLGNRCNDCHSSDLKPLHTGTTLYNDVTCAECHNSDPLVVASNWRGTTAGCDDCHGAAGTGFHMTYGAATHVATDGTYNCASSGAGCHNTDDLRDLHKATTTQASTAGCTVTDTAAGGAACHAIGGARPTAKSCGSGQACHKNYTDSTGHKVAVTGNEALYHQATSGMSVNVDATYTNANGDQCSDCHSAALMSAHSTSANANTCTGCHNDTAPNSTLVIKTNSWSTKTCDECHVTNLNGGTAKHTTYAGGHDGTPLGGNHCGTECHGTTGNDLRRLHDGAASSSAVNPGCTADGTGKGWARCHGIDFQTVATSKTCGDPTAACHKDKTDLNHSFDHQATSGGSNYNAAATYAAAPAGCTNTGTGCHGTSLDLKVVHNKTMGGCSANKTGVYNCHDIDGAGAGTTAYSSVDYTQPDDNNECIECHAGAYTGPPATSDRNLMTDAYPSGHFNVTTHTANATYMGALVDTGTYTLGNRCDSCHSGNLRTTHTGTTTKNDVVCVECHTINSAVVASNWRGTGAGCDDCHGVLEVGFHQSYDASHTATDGTLNCASSGAGCHNTSDLRDLHKSTTAQAATAGCTITDTASGGAACHALGVRPTAKSCGTGQACHTAYTDSAGHKVAVTGAEALYHQATTGMDATISWTTSGTVNIACSSCHSASLTTAHATSANANTCVGCHNDTVPNSVLVIKTNSWSTKTCDECHVTNVNGGTARHNTYANHTGTSSLGCLSGGAGCHDNSDLRALHAAIRGEATTSGCMISGCHAANKDMSNLATAPKDCANALCHPTYTATTGHKTSVTGNEALYHQADSTAMTSTVDGATYNTGGGNRCGNCHSAALLTAHGTSANANSCTGCHSDSTPNAVKVIKTDSWSAKTCEQCHVTNVNGGTAMHNTIGNHNATAGSCGTLAASCHGWVSGTTIDVRAAHNRVGAGCTAAGTQPTCHAIDTVRTTGTMGCGSGATGTITCHTTTASGHGVANHDIDNIWSTTYASQTTTFTYQSIAYGPSKSVGCGGTASFGGASAYSCHFSDLVKEHGTQASGGAGRSMDRLGVNCGVCHAAPIGSASGSTVGLEAADSVISGAITGNDLRCETCHSGTADSGAGVMRGHQSTVATGSVTTGSSQIGVTTVGGGEFRSWKTNGVESSGGHRAFNYLPNWPLGQGTTAIGTINGVAVGTGLDPLGTYSTTNLNPRTNAAFVFGDIVLCEDCHWYNAAPNGPQGASVPFYVDGQSTRPTTHWYNGSATQASNPPAPCNRCHLTLSGNTHRSKHTVQCQACHVRIPHAWKRPRLMRRVAGTNGVNTVPDVIAGVSSDQLPYAVPAQGDSMMSFAITAGQTNFGTSGDCNTNCATTIDFGNASNLSGHDTGATGTTWWP